MLISVRILIFLVSSLPGLHVFAQEKPALRDVHRIRLAEAFTIGEKIGNKVWSGWHEAPFSVLLITPDYEFLIRHPRPSADFTLLGNDTLLKSDVHFRKRTQPVHMLATFPLVGGISTIVIGQAENTDKKTSTPWVVIVLHEHFHQLQSSQPSYYSEVNSLNLSRGDQSGMWMLNFAFPYKDERVIEKFSSLSQLLAQTLQAKARQDFESKLSNYLKERKAFQELLSPDDYKYFSFQLWQEGIARYTEFRIADLAASKYKPTKAFRSLQDYTPFREVADTILNSQILSRLPELKIEKSERLAFYPFGAAEGLLLDRANPRWHGRYLLEKFYLDRYFVK